MPVDLGKNLAQLEKKRQELNSRLNEAKENEEGERVTNLLKAQIKSIEESMERLQYSISASRGASKVGSKYNISGVDKRASDRREKALQRAEKLQTVKEQTDDFKDNSDRFNHEAAKLAKQEKKHFTHSLASFFCCCCSKEEEVYEPLLKSGSSKR